MSMLLKINNSTFFSVSIMT